MDAFTQSSYKMIGLPGNIDIPMSQLLSGANKTDWKAFYDNGAAENYLVSYDGSTTFNFKPGKGFWILSKNNINISKDYGPVALSVDNTYSITLQNGWNIISNPFEKNVSWNLIKTINSVTQPIYFFNQGYTQPVSFEPYKGYYFFNQGNLPSLKIPYNPGGVVNQQFKLGK
ncbi:MAG: hypothetical protein H3C45_11985, partial [Bacteroidia bacterium]|nr:hypothetical protein [Bacteroidia bacterium]